ncbi:site-specific DNA-methyltransferase [Antarcticimicrobium sediminis]|uniref:Methyltransferase n=2 Tax=Antarcticimicrobium sediminis TaxID=2546227 RepID=A0A4R5EI08_9RHOB|nr:site-specific DNA-methyltransferase [Antarcticimicrobium sediminis]
MADLDSVDHVICDPAYEQSLHTAKNSGRAIRADGGVELRRLDFDGIDSYRADFVAQVVPLCRGWFIAFCTVEGTTRWADVINPAKGVRYKRACGWIKPDCAPQFNGQGPGSWCECFVTAWCGTGYARWNAGGKRGVYTHQTNPRDRHGGHPTEKPWRLMRDILFDFTNPGDLVLDPFMGSGTTLVSAVLSGRRAIGIELNPDYFNMAVARVRVAVAQAHALGIQCTPQVQGELI